MSVLVMPSPRSDGQRESRRRQSMVAPPWRMRVSPLMLRVADKLPAPQAGPLPEPRHVPVLAEEVLAYLAPRPGDAIVDATVGLGGHSMQLLPRIAPGGQLIGLDQDPEALRLAEARLGAHPSVTLRQANFRHLPTVLNELGIPAVDGVLVDLGVSSMQLETPARGFSFQHEAPLDMRMDPAARLTARDLVNRLPERALADCFWRLGEERRSRRIARAIAQARRQAPIATTAQLASLIARAAPVHGAARLHPATRVFQALRMAVNQELEALQDLLRDAPALLAPGGRLVVIAFHSLEDRLVKQAFRAAAQDGPLRLLTRKPVRPSDAEVAANPRARSARLRAAMRTGAA